MNEVEIIISVNVQGSYTEKQLEEFIYFQLVGGSIDNNNPFIEDDGSEIHDIDFY